MLAHVARRDMAGIDARESRREQVDEGRLRTLQVEADRIVGFDGHLLQVRVPRLTRVLAQPGLALPLDRVPGTLHVLRREGLAVVPGDAGMQLEAQRLVVLAPGRSEEHTSELQSLMRISYA